MARKTTACPNCGLRTDKGPKGLGSMCVCRPSEKAVAAASVWDDETPPRNDSVVGMDVLAGVMKSMHSALIQNTMHLKILGEQIDRLADILAPMSAGYQRDTAPKRIAKTPVQSSEPSNRASKLELD